MLNRFAIPEAINWFIPSFIALPQRHIITV